MISIKNVSKSFGDLDALQKVNLNVNKGSIYGLVGSNGAGKTTLLKLLAGIYKQDRGEVQIAGENVFENVKIKSGTVFIPDSLYFFPQYTITNMANYYKTIYPSWSNERYEKLIKIFNIDVNKSINSLSKGMQRQVAFWLSLSTMPKVMLLDEPLDGLDPVMRQKVKNLIMQDVADKEMTILISSHNLRELEDICDHIGILHKGNLILEKDLDELKADVHKIQIAFKDKVPEELLNNAHILHKEERGSVLLLIVRGNKPDVIENFNKFNPVIIDVIPLTLEEIFIYEMGEVGYEIENIIL
ncbi:ABC transporter ATP-binding protein [Clostridium tagluense]|uniref:ABC transporter ATP-binding protein n=1 Tax=Clostridium tagluense TaxID=360422 RepID=UPI001C0D3EF3|nr:ABC transporter ATP-binding protein [Clostridium tagluense]MBU3127817.1 ABC transporter ATP-binding protein [Clostridium tagluense]MCB2310157.1 ABC transporter ATP-binding protein [Clostridium tagluense]MCB2315201.1 ABC transporter ATP-binding protein [Clostridium tagluense]MCB2319857.1 ABC transporter ATP-binding protein [Clostridium tagluense]MCB2324944.1 ABC transporter ATP-binding protein [Clostridium tagluense]